MEKERRRDGQERDGNGEKRTEVKKVNVKSLLYERRGGCLIKGDENRKTNEGRGNEKKGWKRGREKN